MANIIKLLRSITSGVRPSGKTYGEPYVNFADNQFGVFDSSNVYRDLIGVPVFSSATSYNPGYAVQQGGQVYVARTAVVPGAFNPAQWTPVISQRDYAGGMVNKFRNGTFETWQCRTPSNGAGNIAVNVPNNVLTYTADGWAVGVLGAAMSVAPGGRISGTSTFSSLVMNGVAGITALNLHQRIEAALAAVLGGVPVTIQYKIYNQTGATITPALLIGHANALNNFAGITNDLPSTNLQPCPNNVVTTVAYTFNVPVASAVLGLQMTLSFGGVTNASGKNILIAEADVRVTLGYPVGLCSNPPPPELRAGGQDDILNYKYYQCPYIPQLFGGCYCVAGSVYGWVWNFIVPMRTAPSFTYVDWQNNGFPAGQAQLSLYGNMSYGTNKTCNVTTNSAYFEFFWSASAEL
jgi:hypothetical protein